MYYSLKVSNKIKKLNLRNERFTLINILIFIQFWDRNYIIITKTINKSLIFFYKADPF
jgi:hypothetical protein